ncbi:uncharacterized protein LOC120781321 [Bactrocera tryoni]|uniref:uncharacterized protein LOC120781321 n=1 Tax=Bactrocera tryoni TaxID=59916 RepID=UPI001A970F2C|nr:uncharacterized protein LOC120781321 [Bactrocera tryoni]
MVNGLLDKHCSIFTSEIFAIYQAALIASKSKGKFCICTDSQSAIDAVKNFTNKSVLVTYVRDLLTKHANKMKLIELADSVAKSIHEEPDLCFDALEKADLKHLIKQYVHNKSLLKWIEYVHHYAATNPIRAKPIYPTNSKHSDILLFTRLRLGHTQITHDYLLNNGNGSCCFCRSSRTSVKHILDACPQFTNTRRRMFGTALPSKLLTNITSSNISTISNFLITCNIAHLI